jgi:hypothetical protein
MPILNFLPLLVWMLGFYALNLWRAPDEKRAAAVFFAWLLGTLIFAAVGIFTTLCPTP